MGERIWKVTKVTLTTDALKVGRNACYPYAIEGTFQNGSGRDGETFAWRVPNLDGVGYEIACEVPAIPRGSVYESLDQE